MDSANQARPASRLPAQFHTEAPHAGHATGDARKRSEAAPSKTSSTSKTSSNGGAAMTGDGVPSTDPGQAAISGQSLPRSENSGMDRASQSGPASQSSLGSQAGGVNRVSGSGVLPVPDESLSVAGKAAGILKIAADAFARTGNWIVFYRDVLGVNGVVRRTFKTEAEQAAFQDTPQFAELLEMVAALRSQDVSRGDSVEPEKMITIRLPESLHAVLTSEAESMKLSINKLCISKLIQPVEGRFVPIQQGRRRGRRPGPQGSRKKTSQGKS